MEEACQDIVKQVRDSHKRETSTEHCYQACSRFDCRVQAYLVSERSITNLLPERIFCRDLTSKRALCRSSCFSDDWFSYLPVKTG